MTTELLDPDEAYTMPPEMVAVATMFLETNDIDETATALGIEKNKVIALLNNKEVKRFIDTVFLEQGYFNRSKISSVMTEMIDKKLLELEEAEIGSNKDIADLMVIAHKMRMDEIKAMQAENKTSAPGTVNNTQINGASFGNNYNDLLGKLVNDGSK